MKRLLIIPILALALNGCSTDCRSPIGIFEAPKLPAGVLKTPEEDAAITVLKLGYDRWVVACAFAVAKDGKSLDEAMKKCVADFDLEKGKEEV